MAESDQSGTLTFVTDEAGGLREASSTSAKSTGLDKRAGIDPLKLRGILRKGLIGRRLVNP